MDVSESLCKSKFKRNILKVDIFTDSVVVTVDDDVCTEIHVNALPCIYEPDIDIALFFRCVKIMTFEDSSYRIMSKMFGKDFSSGFSSALKQKSLTSAVMQFLPCVAVWPSLGRSFCKQLGLVMASSGHNVRNLYSCWLLGKLVGTDNKGGKMLASFLKESLFM
jgi:hypothetical protein